MLDLNKLEAEIDSFIATETAESYTNLFDKADLLGFINEVEISGGYTSEFSCSKEIIINRGNIIENDSDFFDQNISMAA